MKKSLFSTLVTNKSGFYFLLIAFYFLLSTCSAQNLSWVNDSNYTWWKTTLITLTIQVPNEYLKNKSILETATIYGVDVQVLAQKISEHYLNKFQVQSLDNITDLQKNYWIDIDKVKEIAQWLQNSYPASSQQKQVLVQVIKEQKIFNQREFVFRSVVAIMCLYFVSYFLTYRELMHHNIHKKAWNTLLSISVIGYAIIILSYLIPQIYLINMSLWLDIIYQNLRIWFIIIFLWFSHALRYIFHYRPLKKKLHHKISHHEHIHHKETHKPSHKNSKHKHTTTKAKKV